MEKPIHQNQNLTFPIMQDTNHQNKTMLTIMMMMTIIMMMITIMMTTMMMKMILTDIGPLHPNTKNLSFLNQNIHHINSSTKTAKSTKVLVSTIENIVNSSHPTGDQLHQLQQQPLPHPQQHQKQQQ